MWWLWFAGPLAVVVIYVISGLDRSERDERIRAAEAWRNGPGAGAKLVRRLTPDFSASLEDAGGGEPLRIYELFPKLAFVTVVGSDAVAASDHQTVVGKLEGPAISFTARPLPIVDGKRAPNTGVTFPKDPDFMAEFLVEGEDAAATKKWLSKPIREALLDLPASWLRVRNGRMTLTLYGAANEDLLDALIVCADAIFAEHGADGGPSLLGDEADQEPNEAPVKPPSKKANSAGKPPKKNPAKQPSA
jgi:hypothetical protein